MDVLQTLLDSIEDPGDIVHDHRPYRKRKAAVLTPEEDHDLASFSLAPDSLDGLHDNHAHDHDHGHDHHDHLHDHAGVNTDAKVPKLSPPPESERAPSLQFYSDEEEENEAGGGDASDSCMPAGGNGAAAAAAAAAKKPLSSEIDPRLTAVSPEVDPALAPLHYFTKADEKRMIRLMKDLLQSGQENHPLMPLLFQPNIPPCCQRNVIKKCKAEATCGNSAGFYILGMAAFKGYGGVAQDDQTALIFLREAAELGNPYALNALGVFYEHGFCGLKASDEAALGYYTQAASLNNGNGLCNLGLFIERGVAGLAKDEAKALKLFQLSAERENPNGRYCLALYHYYGKGGLPVDREKAVVLFRLAAKQCNPDAEDMYGDCLANGYGVAQDPLKAVLYLSRSAVQGNISGMRDLAFAYYAGRHRKDMARAFYWYQKAISVGDETSFNALRAIRNRFGKELFETIKAKADALIEEHNLFVDTYLKNRQQQSEPL